MPEQARTYGYRWVTLAAFMAVNLTIQVLWISYAPVSREAQGYFGVSSSAVGALAMSFMVVYLPVSFLASHLLARRGLRVAAGVGALLAGVCGVLRGVAGPHYGWVLLATVGAAVAQPFLLNAWTTMSTDWFPPSQRATAVSLITLANLVGAGVGMAVTPVLSARASLGTVQLGYGVAALVAGLVFVVVARDHPPTPSDTLVRPEPTATLVGVRRALGVTPFVVFLGVAFVAMGVFNGLSTWVEEIVGPRGFSSVDAGNLGALLLLGGVVGAVVVSALSDRARKRIPFLTASLLVAGPALLWLTFAGSLAALDAAAFVLGFFLTSALPVGMQYAAEITAPTPEGTSNGLIQLAGQASVVVVYLMALTRTPSGSFVPSLGVLAALLVLSALAVSRLPEPATLLVTAPVPVAVAPAPAPALALPRQRTEDEIVPASTRRRAPTAPERTDAEGTGQRPLRRR